jgi:hypothetical protein
MSTPGSVDDGNGDDPGTTKGELHKAEELRKAPNRPADQDNKDSKGNGKK